MIRYEDECVECGLPCLGNSCPYKKVKHLYCDKCHDDVEKLYLYEGQELCEECLLEAFETIEL